MTAQEHYMFRMLILQRLYQYQEDVNQLLEEEVISLFRHTHITIHITSEINYISGRAMCDNFSYN
tara:strand:+ start:12178 stop:12372 length:195 start_codon:yes stop_codon:yes gene_type:complete